MEGGGRIRIHLPLLVALSHACVHEAPVDEERGGHWLCSVLHAPLPIRNEAQAICLARTLGLTPSPSDEYYAREYADIEMWEISSVLEDECDQPNHVAGVHMILHANTAEVVSSGSWTATTVGITCGDDRD